MVKLKKQERQSSLESHITEDPFLTDEQRLIFLMCRFKRYG